MAGQDAAGRGSRCCGMAPRHAGEWRTVVSTSKSAEPLYPAAMADHLDWPADVRLRAAWDVTERMLSEDLPRRWRHSQGVLVRANLAAPELAPEDGNVLRQAAILHDVGYAVRVGIHRISSRGRRSLSEVDWLGRPSGEPGRPPFIARVEAEELGLGAAIVEFEPGEAELTEFLIFSDMTTSPDGLPVTVDERLAEILERYGPESQKARFVALAGQELRTATLRVAQRLAGWIEHFRR